MAREAPDAWRFGPAAVALTATLAVLLTISPGDGPGITCDECYDVWAGKQLVHALTTQKAQFFTPDRAEENFGRLASHPPLGRWMLGAVHALFDALPEEPDSFVIQIARCAPALAFGALILIVGTATARVAGPLAGTTAALSTALMPRMFAHAHFATLDTFACLTYVGALVILGWALTRRERWLPFALAGAVFGLAMLTKLHGLLLVVPGTVVMVGYLRRRALFPTAIWLACGLITFFAGWPLLWSAPLDHFFEYLGTATDRQTLTVFYAGRIWNDVDVPWHYPWIMFLVTMPVGFLFLGAVGVGSRRRQWLADPRLGTLAAGGLWIMLVFSWPGTPVYDGVRLFLMVFPVWAVAVGLGMQHLFETERLSQISRRSRSALAVIFLAAQSVGIVAYHPYETSYYNLLAGGLWGAEKLGFEVTYWGDTVRGEVVSHLADIAKDESVLYAPQLAPFQAATVGASWPLLVERKLALIGWDASDSDAASGCRYAVVYQRKSASGEYELITRTGRLLAENQRQGVWLARLYELPSPMKPQSQRESSPSSLPERERPLRPDSEARRR